MITFRKVAKRYGLLPVLHNITFGMGEGDRTALVGENGVGKSTVLRLAAGVEKPDRGEIIRVNRALMGYLPQETPALPEETLDSYLHRISGIAEAEERLTEATEENYDFLLSQYERLGGYDFEGRVSGLLEGLLIDHLPRTASIHTLSGGEKRKVALAAVLLRGADILILDEPTNNLDLPAILWLEHYLRSSHITLLVASHDRSFLDNVVTKVIEVTTNKREIVEYGGGWSDYAALRLHKLNQAKEAHRVQEAERARTKENISEKDEWIEIGKIQTTSDHDKLSWGWHRNRSTQKHGSTKKALFSRLDRLTDSEAPYEPTPLHIELEHILPAHNSGISELTLTEDGEPEVATEVKPPVALRCDIQLKKVALGYSDRTVLHDVSLTVPYGMRMAVLGANGAGKSTLLKAITGNLLPISGTVTTGADIRWGNMMQEHENIPTDVELRKLFAAEFAFEEWETRDHLYKFRFTEEYLRSTVSELSPGERVRVILALFSARGVNVLVLDEPTNHLDMDGIEALEEAVKNFHGTVIVVTHDRMFFESLNFANLYVVAEGVLSLVKSYQEYKDSLASRIERALRRFTRAEE
jgi:ATPase subunit of ABC transporter with duplicated ATPase domains